MSGLLLLYSILLICDHSLLSKSLRLVDYESLSAITSFLVISRGLELSGIFNKIVPKIVELSGGSEIQLHSFILIIVAISSTVIMNDTAIFIFIPLVVIISKILKINRAKVVTLTTISANIGSTLTPIGNPQNVIIWRTFKIPFHVFVWNLTPYVLGWISILLIFTLLTSRKQSVINFTIPGIRIDKNLLTASIILLIVDVMLVQFGYALIGIAITLAVLTIVRKEVVLSIDVALILTFALIFIDFKELSMILLSANLWLYQKTFPEIIIFSAGLSQIISNVPVTVLFASINEKIQWLPLAVGVNLGGAGVVIGSLANLIAVRISGIRLRDFHKFSLPYFFAILSLTLAIIWL